MAEVIKKAIIYDNTFFYDLLNDQLTLSQII